MPAIRWSGFRILIPNRVRHNVGWAAAAGDPVNIRIVTESGFDCRHEILYRGILTTLGDYLEGKNILLDLDDRNSQEDRRGRRSFVFLSEEVP